MGSRMKILLTPHADDETLFACYTLLRERPLVVLCRPGAPRHGSFATRLGEFAAAMAILDCQWINIAEQDYNDDELFERLGRLDVGRLDVDHVYAPLPEPDGNTDHNLVGEMAAQIWPGNVTFYATYTADEKTTLGQAVPYEATWPALKRKALACYPSQKENRLTRPHFLRPLDEYLVAWSEVENEVAA